MYLFFEIKPATILSINNLHIWSTHHIIDVLDAWNLHPVEQTSTRFSPLQAGHLPHGAGEGVPTLFIEMTSWVKMWRKRAAVQQQAMKDRLKWEINIYYLTKLINFLLFPHTTNNLISKTACNWLKLLDYNFYILL